MASGDTDSFVHLHVHTEYSMLDGAARLSELFAETARMGMPALAMTDHGNVFGAHDFYTKATAAGVKPIIGLEAYVTPGTSRFDRSRVRWADGGGDDVSGGGAFTHMTLLAETTAGMHNLFRLSSRSSLEGFFYKPRADRELLSQYAAGLIATTGCPSGEVQTWLRIGDYDKARASAAEFRDIFGQDNYFIELMDHGLEIETRVRDGLLRLARDLQLPIIATNDLHYTHAEDADAHEILCCIQSGKTMADPKRFKLEGRDYYLKTPAEMRSLWADKHDLREACDNTLLIAERCNVAFAEGVNLMPQFPVPPGEDEGSWFVKEVERGLSTRYPGGLPPAVRERADYEVAMILQMGFPSYFLVVADLINWAREHGIRVGPGRGSAAGSLVAYAMRITGLDPLEHGLLFERFLNPARVTMPDIDIDFDERRRGEVMAYVTDKYGDDRVAQVVTYGTIKAKQAVKDASRVLGYPFAMGERITKAMPPSVMGKDVPLNKIFDKTDARYGEGGEFRALVEADGEVKRVVETAQGLEGLKRQWGVHACAVIMSSVPLIDTIPIMKREQDGAIITQFDYPTCEALGLLKMDFLGLRNLTIVDDALANIKANRGETILIEDLPFDDQATYDLLARGDTLGVFQLDGGPLRALLRAMRPEVFDHITAVIALYRPGPMGTNAHNDYADRKNGRKPVVPIHPELDEPLREILGETYGLVVYQEQVMAIAQKVAGYSLASADLLRRAMGKKKKKELEEQYAAFSAGMAERGFSAAAVKALWDTLLPFCDYGFNKSHGAGYAVVSYWTAYLKANYPAEYMAALLTSVRDDKDKSAIYLAECRHMGIKVLPPCVNSSDARVHPDRRRHPLRPDRDPQRRQQRRQLDRDHSQGPGRLRGLRRLPAQGRCHGLQQAHHRGPDQGRRLRLPRPSPPRADEHLRAGRRRGARHQAGRGHRPVRPVRQPGRNQPGRRRVRGARAAGRVGQEGAAAVRARDARAVRLRPPAARARAHPERFGRHDDRGRACRGQRRAAVGHADRHPLVGEPPHHQGRGALGPGRARGPRGLHRGDVLPDLLRPGGADDRRGRHRRHQGPHRRARGHRQADRQRPDPARHQRRAARAGRGQDGPGPVHAADGRPAARRAGHPSRHDRGAPAPGQRRAPAPAQARRRVPSDAVGRPDGRPESAARPRRRLGLVPRHTERW